jgi:hypothetical protein
MPLRFTRRVSPHPRRAHQRQQGRPEPQHRPLGDSTGRADQSNLHHKSDAQVAFRQT